MKTLHRIVSVMGLALLLSVALISLGNAPGAAAETDVVAAATANAGWEEMGAGSASGGGISQNNGVSGDPSLATGPDGAPIVAWRDNSGGNSEIYVKRWNGSKWVEMGSGSATGGGISNNAGFSEVPSLAIDPDGKAVVAWQDDSGSKYKPEIYVKRWDGSAWVEMGAGSASGGGISNNPGYSMNPSLAIGPDGAPAVAWADDSSGKTQIYVRRWNGSAWAEMGAGSASGGGINNTTGYSGYPSLAIGPDGAPAVAWADDSSGKTQIYVRRWNGSAWAEMGAGSASGGGISNNSGGAYFPSLAIGPDGNPVVAWADDSSGNAEIYAKRWDGSAWVEMGAGSASGGGVSQTGLAGSPSLAIGPDGVPIIGWRDGSGPPGRISNGADNDSEIYVKRWNGSAWVEIGAGSASGGGISNTVSYSEYPSLAIGPNGLPVVAWQDNSGGNREIYARRYAGACYSLSRSHTGQGSDPTASPANSGSCSNGQYTAGTSISLAASPAAGWRVKSWSGTNNDGSIANSNTVTMPAANRTVSVNYEQIPSLAFRSFIPAAFYKP